MCFAEGYKGSTLFGFLLVRQINKFKIKGAIPDTKINKTNGGFSAPSSPWVPDKIED